MKTVLITGASSGIGRETAIEFAKNNYNLILTARRKDKLETLKEELMRTYSVSVQPIEMDLGTPNSAEALFDRVASLNATVDVLINNAGFGLSGRFLDLEPRRVDEMLILNMLTLTKLTRLFASLMQDRGGTIVNIASTAAFQPIPNMASYAATKSYVLSFSQAIAYELRGSKVKIRTVCPGPTKSEFADVAGLQGASLFKNAPTSQELAQFIFATLKSGRYARIHGLGNRLLRLLSIPIPTKIVMAMTGKLMGHKE
jgi:short-subunit dehydrogenase